MISVMIFGYKYDQLRTQITEIQGAATYNVCPNMILMWEHCVLVWFSTTLRVLVKRGIALKKDRESYCGSHPSPHSCSLVKASSRLPSSVWRAPFEDQHSTQRDEGSIRRSTQRVLLWSRFGRIQLRFHCYCLQSAWKRLVWWIIVAHRMLSTAPRSHIS